MNSGADILLKGLNTYLQIATPQALPTVELCRDLTVIIASREEQGANFDSRIILLVTTVISLLLTKNFSTNLDAVMDKVRPTILNILMEDILNGLS